MTIDETHELPDKPGARLKLSPFRLGQWLVRPTLNQISSDGKTTHLEPKVMEVLVCLAEAKGKVVTKDEFMDRVWADTVVTNDVLSRCISELRKIFDDSASEPRYIETIRKTGYRLLIEVGYEESTDSRSGRAAAVRQIAHAPKPWTVRRRYRPWIWSIMGGAGVAIAIFALQAIFADSGAPSQAVPFTTFPGEEIDPNLSPDGKSIAFSWNGGSGEDFDLYLKQIGGEQPLRLTEAPGKEHNPTWSADGQKIAFVRNLSGTSSVHVIPNLGGSERLLASFDERNILDLQWSPSGTFLAASAQRAPYSAYSIFLISLETLAITELTKPPLYIYGDTSPAFAPGEKKVAFVRSITSVVQDIYVVSIGGDEPERLTFDSAKIAGIDWNHETNEILFASDREGASSLWRIMPSGSKLEWIVSAGDNADVGQPSVARDDSRRLTFERRSSNSNIWQLKRAQASQRLIASTRWDSNPSISADGSKIAFVSNQSGHYELWICDSDGQNPIQLTSQEGGFLGMPRFSPDGTHIAYASWKEEHADVFIIAATGGSPRRLLNSSFDELSPNWSNDGQWLYYASNKNGAWQIFRTPTPAAQDSALAVADSTQLIINGAIAALEADDGASLFFVKQNEPGLWHTQGDSAIQVISSLLPTDKDNWSVVGRGIYFIRRDGSQPVIAYYSLTTGRTTQIAVLDHLPDDHSFTVSPDGLWFLYTQEENRESDILLLDDRE